MLATCPETTLPSPVREILVLGIGNSIMSDDGVGPALADALGEAEMRHVRCVDGGTCGLALLPHIEAADGVVVLDALRLGKAPGAVTVLEGDDMDRALRGVKSTAHEVALADLLDAARATGRLPERRAIVGVEPQVVTIGTELSVPVAAAMPRGMAAATTLIERWTS